MLSALIIDDIVPLFVCLIVLAVVFVSLKFLLPGKRRQRSTRPEEPDATAAWLKETLERERDRVKREHSVSTGDPHPATHGPDAPTDSLLD